MEALFQEYGGWLIVGGASVLVFGFGYLFRNLVKNTQASAEIQHNLQVFEHEKFIAGVVGAAVSFAEGWASEYGVKVQGPEKKVKAFEFVRKVMDYRGVDYNEGLVSDLIDATVASSPHGPVARRLADETAERAKKQIDYSYDRHEGSEAMKALRDTSSRLDDYLSTQGVESD